MSDIATDFIQRPQAQKFTTIDPNSTGKIETQQKTLGQAEFFKLLTTQLASQDPLKPMDDTAFIAQMANFSELEMKPYGEFLISLFPQLKEDLPAELWGCCYCGRLY